MKHLFRDPAELGFDSRAIEDAWSALVHGAMSHEYGGAVALVGRHGQIALHRSTGWAVREPQDQRAPMGIDTIFDLASLTKVIATTPSILKLVAEGRIGLDQPVGEILPDFGIEGLKAGVTIKRLLTHSAGFRAGFPVSAKMNGEKAYIDAIAASQPEWGPNTRVLYSDLGFITLGAVINRVAGEALDVYAERHIFRPLGMIDTMYTPPRSLRPRIAATELRQPELVTFVTKLQSPLRRMTSAKWQRSAAVSVASKLRSARKGDSVTRVAGNAGVQDLPDLKSAQQRSRDTLIRGDVHDGNAWFGLGGIAGHAGLFGTAIDLYRYGQMWLKCGKLDAVQFLPQALVTEAITNQTNYDDGTDRRGYGWQLQPPPGSPENKPQASRGMSQRAFGHSGFTGTSIWMDPAHDLVVVLLTNRLHPTATTDYLHTRARFNQAVVAAIRD